MKMRKKQMSKNYWNDRLIRAREALLDKTIEEIYKELQKVYRGIAKSLIEKLEKLFKEMEEKGQANVLASHQYSYNKYYSQLRDIQKQMNELGIAEEDIMKADFTKYFIANSNLVGEQLGIANRVSKKEAVKTIFKVWAEDGKSFSDRIWTDKKALMAKLEIGLPQIIATGTGKSELIKSLVNESIATSFSNARRLVVTELSHLYNTSTLQRYSKAGIKEVQWLAEIDNRVCPECRAMNGRKFPIKKAQNKIPKHPFCRCTWLAIIPKNNE